MDRSVPYVRAAIVSGIFMVLITITMSQFYPAHLDTLPEGFITPILAIEFMASHTEARQIFADNRDLIAQVQTGHWIDMIFLLSYCAFLALPNILFWLRQRHWSSIAGIMAAVIAAVADAAENWKLLQAGNALLGENVPPDFSLLRLYMGTKFLAISISMLCLSRSLFQQGTLGKIFASLSLVLVPVTMIGLDGNPVMIEAMTGLIVVAWITLFIWLVRTRNGFPVAVSAID